jgi:multimeric flavodoxin WrbA
MGRLKEALKGSRSRGAEITMINISELKINACKACMFCRTNTGCAIKDDMQGLYKEIEASDVVVFGFPIYMLSMNAQTKTVVDRLFPYLNKDFTSKINKKTLLVVTQGTADKNAFSENIKSSKDALTLLGFSVKKVIVEGNGNAPGAHAKNSELMLMLEKSGAELVSAS